MLFDRTFEAAFRRLFVYNILFEDSEVDGRYLGIDDSSRVLGISAAGCGLASMIRFHPIRIDAVDINGHHLSLAALKMQAAKRVESYGLLYDLFGYGRVTKPEDTVRSLANDLPSWIQKYWRGNHGRFKDSFYERGLTAWMLSQLRRHVGLGTGWMHNFIRLDRAERMETIVRLAEPVLQKPWIKSMLNSPLQQLALGVNNSQKGRMLHGGEATIVDFVLGHLKRVAATDVETNWFAWYAAAGHYNHAHPQAVPPYLRRESHAASVEAPTEFGFHHRSIFDVLAQGTSNNWTHYSLCDAMDWMPRPVQKNLLSEILRTAEPGARVLLRSVDTDDIVEACGFGGQFVRMDTASDQATIDERSCQYKRVDFYEVHP